MAGPYESRHNGKRVDVMYATFTTPANAISGSAVCAFRLHDVERVFDGAFKEQAALNANWLPVAGHKVFFHSIPQDSGPAAARTLPSIDPAAPSRLVFFRYFLPLTLPFDSVRSPNRGPASASTIRKRCRT